MRQPAQWIYRNSLTIVFVCFMVASLVGQVIFGLHEHNQFLAGHGQRTIGIGAYLQSGHFLQATFENWESEFLQMALFIILTIFLRQKGSSESKSLDKKEECDREPVPAPNAPWAVRKGGWVLAVYKHSLSIAFILLFLGSFVFHFYGSWIDYNQEQQLQGGKPSIWLAYMGNSKFWFESFQNWQSEFLSVAAIVFLSIYLRQKGSPQSKPVDMPHGDNE